MDARSGHRPGSAEQSDGALFELYVDAILDGEVELPGAFLARHPDDGRELEIADVIGWGAEIARALERFRKAYRMLGRGAG